MNTKTAKFSPKRRRRQPMKSIVASTDQASSSTPKHNNNVKKGAEKKIRARLIEQALMRHKKIYPCANHGNLNDCFTVSGNRILFWFNTEDQSTHLVVADYCE
ncbi:MAG: hypothetical protein GF344_07290 [Chitinivibrionales bacterium]|nr:hypothetical protein [Chitinivibrionales bacterium]MBD3356713.1 hypothetical protein [Chitinivibrionales bacterium]